MELQLRIIHDPHTELMKQRVRVFSKSGGRVGRALDNHWVLPDPDCHLSGHHCEIRYSQGVFTVLDSSRNGVFVNNSKHALGFGHSARLEDGDALRLAKYVVRVRLTAHREVPDRAPAKRAVPADIVETGAAAEIADAGETTGEHDLTERGGDEPRAELKPPDPVARGPIDATGEHAIHFDASTGVFADEVAVQKSSVQAEPVLDDLAATRTLDAEAQQTRARSVVHVDRARLQAEGYLPPAKSERLIANQFRHIKRPLIRNALGKGVEAIPDGQLVMVTSSLPGEGKTFNSINLGLSLAREKDLQVVLVDADVAKQTVSRIFGIEGQPGLLNALTDESVDVESLILPTDVPGLQLLPAGQYAEDVATELLASARMDEVAVRLGARSAKRIVLFDSPPLLLTNESRVLASLMGQILLVVLAGETPQQAVLEAIGYLAEDKPVGLVLNQSKAGRPGSYYGYGSYGYGAYGSEL
jgi:protein-tyrosine kinase